MQARSKCTFNFFKELEPNPRDRVTAVGWALNKDRPAAVEDVGEFVTDILGEEAMQDIENFF